MSHFVTKPSDLRHLPYTDYQCVEIVKALRAMDVEADTDDCSLLQAQLIGLMEGEGAPEDHRDVKAALAGMGLTPAGADLVHGCLVNILSAKLFEKSSVLLPVVFPADVPEAAKNMKQNEYRGPLPWTEKVIDFAADYTDASGAAEDLHPVFTRVLPDLPDTKPFTLFKAGFRQALIAMASAPVAPTLEAEAVRWEFRWLNPANNPYSSPSEMAWKLVEPKGRQPLEAALSDLRACRYAGKPCYEVRPLFAQAAPVAPTPPGYALVPLKVPASLYPRLTGYEKPAPGDHHRDHDRQEIESRSAKAWGEIVQAASTQPSTHARNDALADEIVELLDSCECLENGQKENALAIVKRMCSAQFEHSEAQ